MNIGAAALAVRTREGREAGEKLKTEKKKEVENIPQHKSTQLDWEVLEWMRHNDSGAGPSRRTEEAERGQPESDRDCAEKQVGF